MVRNGIGRCNQRLVKTRTRAICELTEGMHGWGLDVIRKDGTYVQVPWEGHMYPRVINHNRVTGKYVMKCPGEKSREMGFDVLPHCVVGGLFKDGEAIAGAWAFDYRNLEFVVIHAKAVILTTGDNVRMTIEAMSQATLCRLMAQGRERWMSRYLVKIRDNLFFDSEPLDDEEEDEGPGLDWAMTEINDAFATIGRIDGEYSMANRDGAREFIEFPENHVKTHLRAQVAAALARLE